jgi:hypothetical protein
MKTIKELIEDLNVIKDSELKESQWGAIDGRWSAPRIRYSNNDEDFRECELNRANLITVRMNFKHTTIESHWYLRQGFNEFEPTDLYAVIEVN